MYIRKKSLIIVIMLIITFFAGEIIPGMGRGSVASADDDAKILKAKVEELRSVAEKFAAAYQNRDYRAMYYMVNPQYRERVKLWEYKDFVEFPGVTDGYIRVEIADVNVMPESKYKYGKVMQKVVTFENQKGKTTGDTVTVEDEKWEFQDWVNYKNKWYKIEKLDSN